MSQTDQAYCAQQTFAATRNEPAEYCEEPVPADGDFCAKHDYDEPDYDQIRKDRIIDEREP